jgi:hypothetical protein
MDTIFINNSDVQSISRQKKTIYNMDNNIDSSTTLTVISDFLSHHDYDKLHEIIVEFLIGGNSSGGNSSNTIDVNSKIKFAHSSIGWHPNYSPHWNFDLTDHDFFNVYMLSKIRSIEDWTQNLLVKRIYCSVQTSQQHGNWHYDDDYLDSYTFTLYCNLNSTLKNSLSDNNYNIYSKYINQELTQNDENYGNFYIKYPNHPMKSIKTKNNNAVLFNSTIMHNGDCYSYDSNYTRCVIAYKLVQP